MNNSFRIIFLLMLLAIEKNSLCQGIGNENSWLTKVNPEFTVHFTSVDSVIIDRIYESIIDGHKRVADYFGKPYNKKFDVYLFPSRLKLDEQWSKEWGVPGFKSECWMAASGVAYRLDVLSPRVWNEEACEHDPDDKNHVQEIITHELVHVFHGQQNPHPDFSGMDEIGWFVEGIAVFVAGQLSNEKIKQLKEAYAENKLPVELENAWSGKYRYPVCGSMVKFIEQRWGKERLIELLVSTSEKEILDELNISEEKFLEDWKNWLNKFSNSN